jgi:FAD/FMN-containing dehydrogenase
MEISARTHPLMSGAVRAPATSRDSRRRPSLNEHHLPFVLRQHIEHRNPRNLTLHVWVHTLGWLAICVLLSRVPLSVSLPFVAARLGANAGAWFALLSVLYWLPVDALVALGVGGITAAFAALPVSSWGPGHGAGGVLLPVATLAASCLASHLSHVYHHERADFMKGEPRARAALDAAHVVFFGPFYFYLEKLLALGYRPDLRRSLDEKARAAILRRRLTPWRNWARNVVASPAVVCVPETAADVADVVREARAAGRKVRVVASGFSWSSFSATDDYLVFCERLDGIEIDAGAEQPSAWVGPGMTNRAINAALAQRGLTLPYNVVMETVRIGGLVSVGTHGSGRDTATMGDLVLALEVVTPEGEIKLLSEETIGAEAMRAVRCSFGTFGIITRIKLRVVRAFRVLQRDSLHDEDALLDELPAVITRHDSVELFWMPYTDKIWLRTLDPTDRPLSLFGNGFWFLTCQFLQMALVISAIKLLVVWFPGVVVPLMRAGVRTLRFGERVLPVADAQHYRRWLELTRCRCIEVAFKMDPELDVAVRAWREARALVAERRARGEFPLNLAVNMRFIGGSDALLSPAFGPGLTGYIEALSTEGTPGWREFSAELARRWMQTRGALPHWAKEFEQIPRIFELARERLGDRRKRFLAAHRAVMGPAGGMFSNRLVERLVFEPPEAEPALAPAGEHARRRTRPPQSAPGASVHGRAAPIEIRGSLHQREDV